MGAGEGRLDLEPASWSRAGGEAGAVCVGDGLDDGQAEAQAFAAADPVGGEPLEWLEEPVYCVSGYGGPGVGDRQDCTGADGLRGDVDLAAWHVVAQGVVYEVRG